MSSPEVPQPQPLPTAISPGAFRFAGIPLVVVAFLLMIAGLAPGWALWVAGAVAALIYLAGWNQWRRARLRLITAGRKLCKQCAYDLRGSPNAGQCPECGAPYSLEEVQWAWDDWLVRRGGMWSRHVPPPALVERLLARHRLAWVSVPLLGGIGVAMESGLIVTGTVLLAVLTIPLSSWVFTRRLLSRARAKNFRLCGACGYDMHGLVGPACPECGEPYAENETAAQWRAWCEDR